MKPRIGERARAREIGFPRSGSHWMQWTACVACGNERWVFLRCGVLQNARCHPCGSAHRASTFRYPRGPNNAHFAGPLIIGKNGYARVWLPEDDALAEMRGKDGRSYEHRVVMARHLGRPLSPHEEVHHLNGDKLDNRLENLEMLTKTEHSRRHKARIAELEAQVRGLEARLAAVA